MSRRRFSSRVNSLLRHIPTIILLLEWSVALSVPSFSISPNSSALQSISAIFPTGTVETPPLNLSTSPQDFIYNGPSNATNLPGYLDFPPSSFIGFGLDMTNVMALDLDVVTQNVLTAWCFFQYDMEKAHAMNLPGSDKTWLVPDAIGWNTDVAGYDSSYITYQNGSATKEGLRAGGQASGRYEVVSGGASVDLGIEKTFQDQFSYAFFQAQQQVLQIRLLNYGRLLNDESLENQIASLPDFNKSDPISLRNYRALFETSGTHIITEVSYGARLSLCVWAENKDSAVLENFSSDVNLAFHGLVTDGTADIKMRLQKQYQVFEKSMQKLCSCRGGNSTLASEISLTTLNDDIWQQFLDWKNSVDGNPAITGFTTQPLWNLVKGSNNSRYNQKWFHIQDAYEYLAAHPASRKTNCRLVINARSGGFDLLSPSAFIIADPSSNVPERVILSATKVYYEADPDILPQDLPTDITIDFIIQNFSPTVDFGLFHSEEGPPDAQNAGIEVTFQQPGGTYVNNDPSIDIKQFLKIPVNPNSMVETAPVQNIPAPATALSIQNAPGQNTSLLSTDK